MSESHPPQPWLPFTLGEVTRERSDRLGPTEDRVAVFGVDRTDGLTIAPKYQSDDLTRYKRIEPKMFAYNPMRLNIGSIGYCSEDSAGGVVSPDYVVFECVPEYLEPGYLNLLTKSSSWQDWVKSAGVGSVRVRIYYRELARMPLRLPSLDEQRAILGVAASLDKKIAHCYKSCGVVEKLADAIFRAWVVDLQPYKAKASGATGYPSMPQPLFDALPSSYTGDFPEGWTLKPLSSIASYLNGLALQKFPPKMDGSDLNVIKISELRRGAANGTEYAGSNVPAEYVIDNGDLIFSWSGTLDVKFWFGGRGALNQHLFKVTSEKFPAWFCYSWIKHHLPSFRSIAASKATTMGHINRQHLIEAKVKIPPSNFLEEMDRLVKPMMNLHASYALEAKKLRAIRDFLMPRLLSGVVRLTGRTA